MFVAIAYGAKGIMDSITITNKDLWKIVTFVLLMYDINNIAMSDARFEILKVDRSIWVVYP